MKYILLFAGTMDDQARYDSMSKEELEASYALAGKWFEGYYRTGKIVSAEELRGPDTATTVTFKNGKPIVTDGPFMEAKEIIGGFAVVDVQDLDEALDMAKSWPGGPVEVRPIVDHSADMPAAQDHSH
jgi:hypothetical protein